MQIKQFLGKSINESVASLIGAGYKVVVIKNGESMPTQITDDVSTMRITIVEENGVVKSLIVG